MKTTLLKWTAALLLVGAAGVYVGSRTVAADANKGDKEKSTRPRAAVVVNDAPLARDAKLATSYATVVKKVAPSVVYIYTTKTVKHDFYHDFFPDELFRRFFGDPYGGRGRAPREFKQRGLGSGVIVTKDGYLLTNNHVVEGADEVKVVLATKTKTEFTAKVVGRDPKTDVAVLKIDGQDLPFITLGDSDQLEVGDVVLAVGNPFGIGQTVTMGIVSATGRNNVGIEEYEDFIQTDAAINPGNSGGALIDVEGRLVGINTAILSRTGGNLGVGFAVPINLARNIMDRLLKDGKVVRGWLGVSLQPDDAPGVAEELGAPPGTGAIITEVFPNSAAKEAGLKSGDVIIEFNGKPVKDRASLRLMVGSLAPGTKVTLKALRDGKEKTFQVTLKEMPENLASLTPGGGAPESTENDALDGVVVTDIDAQARAQYKLPSDLRGALITEVDPDSASYEAGLRPGDVIVEINRKPVTDAEEAVNATKNVKSKRTLVRLWSGGGSRYVVVDESKKK